MGSKFVQTVHCKIHTKLEEIYIFLKFYPPSLNSEYEAVPRCGVLLIEVLTPAKTSRDCVVAVAVATTEHIEYQND